MARPNAPVGAPKRPGMGFGGPQMIAIQIAIARPSEARPQALAPAFACLVSCFPVGSTR